MERGDWRELVRWGYSPCIYALYVFVRICRHLGGCGGRRLAVWPAGESTSCISSLTAVSQALFHTRVDDGRYVCMGYQHWLGVQQRGEMCVSIAKKDEVAEPPRALASEGPGRETGLTLCIPRTCNNLSHLFFLPHLLFPYIFWILRVHSIMPELASGPGQIMCEHMSNLMNIVACN